MIDFGGTQEVRDESKDAGRDSRSVGGRSPLSAFGIVRTAENSRVYLSNN